MSDKLPVDLAKERAIKAIQDSRIGVEIWGDDNNRTMRVDFFTHGLRAK